MGFWLAGCCCWFQVPVQAARSGSYSFNLQVCNHLCFSCVVNISDRRTDKWMDSPSQGIWCIMVHCCLLFKVYPKKIMLKSSDNGPRYGAVRLMQHQQYYFVLLRLLESICYMNATRSGRRVRTEIQVQIQINAPATDTASVQIKTSSSNQLGQTTFPTENQTNRQTVDSLAVGICSQSLPGLVTWLQFRNYGF